jgi:hypothetical protein
MVHKEKLQNDLQARFEREHGPVNVLIDNLDDNTGYAWFNVNFTVSKETEVIGRFFSSGQYINDQLILKGINASSTM